MMKKCFQIISRRKQFLKLIHKKNSKTFPKNQVLSLLMLQDCKEAH